MRKILLPVAALIILSGCGSQNASSKDPLADNTLTVGLECDYAPYNWTTTDKLKSEFAVEISNTPGYCDGYDIMIAQKVADNLGVELEIKKISWDGLIPALNSNQIDVIIAGMSPTEERKQSISFTDAYFRSNTKQLVVVNKDSSFAGATTLSELSDARLSGQQGTFQVELLKQIPNLKDTPLFPDYSALMIALSSGTIDGYIAEEPVAIEHLSANSNFMTLNIGDKDNFVLDEGMTTTAIGLTKDNEDLKNKINDALATISDDARLELMNLANNLSGE